MRWIKSDGNALKGNELVPITINDVVEVFIKMPKLAGVMKKRIILGNKLSWSFLDGGCGLQFSQSQK